MYEIKSKVRTFTKNWTDSSFFTLYWNESQLHSRQMCTIGNKWYTDARAPFSSIPEAFASTVVFSSSIVLGPTSVTLSLQCDQNQYYGRLKSGLLAGQGIEAYRLLILPWNLVSSLMWRRMGLTTFKKTVVSTLLPFHICFDQII